MTPEPAVLVEALDAHWLAAAAGCLNADEEARAARFQQTCHGHTWRAGRAWVRHHLATALVEGPASIDFTIDTRGRPHVVGAPPGFDCNWSHSGPWIALAVSTQGAVGIDIEVIRPDFPLSEVESTVCSPGERRALEAAPDETARLHLFFRLWTAKEALMKATGLGAALDPGAIDVRLQNNQPAGYSSHPAWRIASRENHVWVATWAWSAGG